MLFSGDSYAKAPRANQFEISIIGPGYGEAIIAHLGNNFWVVIDSCKLAGQKDPAPLQYLRDIGVTPDRIRAVVVTHWDDDHIRGMASLVKAASDAIVVLSKSFKAEDFHAYIAAHGSTFTFKASSGVKEISDTLKALGGRMPLGATSSRRILRSDDLDPKHSFPFEFWTLSPSDTEHDNFLAWIASELPRPYEPRRVAIPRIRNDLSVVTQLTVGSISVLFGADLEEEGKKETGWTALLASTGRPRVRSSVFKVPHHGSVTGYHPDVWSSELSENAIAVVTPWRIDGAILPKDDDVRRMAAHSTRAYVTATLKSRKPAPRDRAVERTVDAFAKRLEKVEFNSGMVRLRCDIEDDTPIWDIDCFGGAAALSRFKGAM